MASSPVFSTMTHFVLLACYFYTFIYYKLEVIAKVTAFRLAQQARMAGINGRDLASDENNHFGGDLKFLTIWNLIFQTFYFFWCCITDLVLTSGTRSPIARKLVAFRDWFLAAVAFPIGTLVVVAFWSIWAVDRELIFPKELDEFFPMWLNHVLHTTVLPILLIEMFLVQHKLPSRKSGVLGTIGVALTYLSWILYLGYALDIWVYPVLQVLNGVYFGIFIVVIALVLLGIYLVGEKFSQFCWKGYPDSDYEFTKLD